MGLPADILHPPGSRAAQRHDPSIPAPRKPSLSWVPIRSLGPRHRDRVREHLLELSPADRYLRFGYPASDAQILHYADTLDFDRDEVFGIFNRRLQLLAMAHLAFHPTAKDGGEPAEFGVSVAKRARGRAYGTRLFERAVLHARNRGIDTLVIHALSENSAMLRIVRKAGAVIDREGGESQALLKLPPLDLTSRLDALVEQQAAELDYGWKWQARRVNQLLDAIADVRAGVSGTGDCGQQ